MPDEGYELGNAGASVGKLPAARPSAKRRSPSCPQCSRTGKPVDGQTVRAIIAVSLRKVPQANYLFCRTRGCPVVYFSEDGQVVFVESEVRERVYQKEPDSPDVWICYCFRRSVGELTRGSQEEREGIVADINAGIRASECACDLRNPEGSCCLGKIHSRIKQLAGNPPPVSTTPEGT